MSRGMEREYAGAVGIAHHPFTGMITIRADLSNAKIAKEIETVTGLKMPRARRISGGIGGGMAWMSPDELLVFCPVDQDVANLVEALSDAISGVSLVVDVSHARAIMSISGNGSREVLAKGAPVDMSIDGFAIDDFRRTRLGQVAVAFWMEAAEPDEFYLVCFTSVQEFVFDWLANAAQKDSLPGYL